MKNYIKNVHVIGGGTVSHITNHFAFAAPAYGSTAKSIHSKLLAQTDKFNCNIHLHLTKMAGGQTNLETNEDIAGLVQKLKSDYNTKIVFFNCALVDFVPKLYSVNGSEPVLLSDSENKRKYDSRLETKNTNKVDIIAFPSEKIISEIRKNRKDIFVVGFKTTCGASKQEMYEKGLLLCKKASVNLVLVNDTKTRWNMIVTPEEAAYHESEDRDYVLNNLIEMTWYRSHLTFTQSTVIDGQPVSWNDSRIPNSIRQVVNYCINGNAYKVFNGSTVGHFAVKLSDNEFLTSIRKSNFNKLSEIGMVYVKTDGPDTVIAYGAKPSVGGQSQRIIFREHAGLDCVVHFHSPLKPDHKHEIPVVSQRLVECGSHQCGQNTSSNLKQFGNLKCVMLDQHGPNIVFNKDIDPQEVIKFIDDNFDLTKKTGGYNL